MRFKLLAVAAATAGALTVSATPAGAAPNWAPVDTNSTWKCTGYANHTVSNFIKWKVCEVFNGHGAQVVVVVQSTASVAVSIAGRTWSDYGSNDVCSTSPFNPGFTRGCFGRTVELLFPGGVFGEHEIEGELVVNGVSNVRHYWVESSA
ncbi:hypothetical protein G9272_24285 [Streptomyces asoensis]|uniref:Secreted protein n=1 Tax=Streptomyces asoensis TaxID=249586 RepID=A0A6M4WR17_9ACTN|nr:hypothetical protein [Streptomyces asoensis]QJT03017.1 hypothetical protein G9272_24285 [Streptomyces asoensis]